MHDVVIVGGGPVGLFAAILLGQSGVDVRVLEQRAERSNHSRAIGIHPPALRELEKAGVVETLLAGGIQIPGGIARSAGQTVAQLSFDSLPGPYRCVLAIPQEHTERILEARLYDVAPDALLRETEVASVHDIGSHVIIATADDVVESRLVIGADGARSTVRTAGGLRAPARTYPDTYVMGDFPDSTTDGPTAALYLEPDGIVESFPLPGGVRRWVVRTQTQIHSPTSDSLAQLIRDRTGVEVFPRGNTMLSSFAVRRRIAERFIDGRTILIGDAAHEVSPIGGQGMNLGWLDAAELAPIISGSLAGRNVGREVRDFTARRRRAAFTASRQAHLNMVLGRPMQPGPLALRNNLMSRLAAVPAVHDAVARTFTMH
nr:NAD(P)/FAD-dependent oxidoreductase [Arthrobacter sp. H5]